MTHDTKSDSEIVPDAHPASLLDCLDVHCLSCVRGERRVFADLSFTLNAGGGLLLVGPNGSGKTSLLRLLGLLSPPSSGVIYADGTPIQDDPDAHAARTRHLGHADAIKPVLTVRENVTFWAQLFSQGSESSEDRVDEALMRFGLSALADIPGRMLSAGQKRRTNLARLIAAPAPLWLLDEPATALDRDTVGVLEGVIADHRATGGMVILSTHQPVSLPNADILDMGAYTLRGAAAYGLWEEGPDSDPVDVAAPTPLTSGQARSSEQKLDGEAIW